MNAGHASAAHPMGGGDDQEIVPESRSPRIAPPDETDDDEGSEAFDSGDDGEYLTSAQRRLRECWRVIERTSEENRWQVFKNTGLLLVPLIRNGRLNSSQVANFFQEIAESTGLVESYGQDAVQQVLKEIAAKASPFCEDERELGGAASDAMERIPEWKRDIFTAEDLQTMAFEPLAFLVKDLIPAEGVTLLCSRPKLGKSWLLYDLCIGCAANRYILGSIKPEQGEVLYLALEDSRRRLQRRMTKLLPTFHGKWPKGLTLKTKWRRLHEGGLDDIRAWYKDVKARGGKPVAVAIDVLAKVRKPVGNRQIYEADYEALTGLTQLAIELNLAIIVAHHVRKMGAEDLMETVSGSYGLSGSADTILVMGSKSGGFVLDVRGRDVEATELAIQFSKDTCRWTILGAAAEVHRSDARARVLVELGKVQPLSPKEIMAATGRSDRNAVDQLLFRMVSAGDIKKVGRGEYALPEYVAPQTPRKIDKKERLCDQSSDNTKENSESYDLTQSYGGSEQTDGEGSRPPDHGGDP